jgi:hypothetical protein
MTTNEFNKKYADFIVKRHPGCCLTNKSAIDYLDKEFEMLIQIPNFQFHEIKPRFNFFRLTGTDLSQEKIWEIENKLYELHKK